MGILFLEMPYYLYFYLSFLAKYHDTHENFLKIKIQSMLYVS
jgi:hypothetical protein